MCFCVVWNLPSISVLRKTFPWAAFHTSFLVATGSRCILLLWREGLSPRFSLVTVRNRIRKQSLSCRQPLSSQDLYSIIWAEFLSVSQPVLPHTNLKRTTVLFLPPSPGLINSSRISVSSSFMSFPYDRYCPPRLRNGLVSRILTMQWLAKGMVACFGAGLRKNVQKCATKLKELVRCPVFLGLLPRTALSRRFVRLSPSLEWSEKNTGSFFRLVHGRKIFVFKAIQATSLKRKKYRCFS